MTGASDVMDELYARWVKVMHFVNEKPTDLSDPSGCLCVRGGDRKAGRSLPPEKRKDGWTLNPDKVTCPDCLSWMHA